MGIFGALTTAVSGLDAQSYALENISGNIANSQTVGFKRVDTGFLDLVRDAPANRSVSGSVLAYSQATNTVQGSINSTNISTNVAIDGEGYFVVGPRSDLTGGSTSTNLYTRRGDFSLNADGFLVNGAGYYLKGTTSISAGAATGAIQVSTTPVPAVATTSVNYQANLPANPVTTQSSTGGSNLLDPTSYGTDPVATGTVVASDNATFLSQTVPGTSLSVYGADGSPTTLNIRWGKLSGGTWAAYYQTNSSATGAQVAWQRLGGDFTFNGSGQLTSASTVTIPAGTIDGVALSAITVSTGAGGLTQYDDPTGQVQAATITQNGYTAGQLQKISIDDEGRIVGNYSNGQSVTLAQLSVVQFNGDNGLKRLDGGVYAETPESGPPLVGLNGSKLVSGAVEESNTDISAEFSKLIVTQQAYSANTKVITTAQQLLQDVLNIIR